MNVFEYAMQLELDGKSYYEESAKKMEQPELKRIFLELAHDEQKHYVIFKAIRDGLPVEYEEAKKTKIITEVKTLFQELREKNRDYVFPPDVKKTWEHARELEKKTEDYYRDSAKRTTDAKNKQILTLIADEEHKHWVTMDNIIKFIDRPSHWLENAEWNNLEEY